MIGYMLDLFIKLTLKAFSYVLVKNDSKLNYDFSHNS